MAVTNKFYGKAFLSAFNKEIDWDTDTFKVMLYTTGYTPDQDAHQYKSSVTNEITGTGYTATGVTLTGVTITYTGATNVIMFDAVDAAWTGATFSAIGAVIYDATPATDATRPLIAFIDFGGTVSVTGGTYTLQFNAAGIATITVS